MASVLSLSGPFCRCLALGGPLCVAALPLPYLSPFLRAAATPEGARGRAPPLNGIELKSSVACRLAMRKRAHPLTHHTHTIEARHRHTSHAGTLETRTNPSMPSQHAIAARAGSRRHAPNRARHIDHIMLEWTSLIGLTSGGDACVRVQGLWMLAACAMQHATCARGHPQDRLPSVAAKDISVTVQSKSNVSSIRHTAGTITYRRT